MTRHQYNPADATEGQVLGRFKRESGFQGAVQEDSGGPNKAMGAGAEGVYLAAISLFFLVVLVVAVVGCVLGSPSSKSPSCQRPSDKARP